ncbi:hypothetical protein [Kitasatospora sp. NPDC097643]|uniref:hypothetical protein n=1 Tax=Kitasatospora sp. NPDC097643 TaxID=3157230 RepID=UPI0033266C35
MKDRRTVGAAALLGVCLGALLTACGPDDPDPAPAAAPPVATTAAGSGPAPAPTSASPQPTGPAPTATATPSEAVKPCYQDPARPETAKLNSATTANGVTRANLTLVGCTYQVSNEENVEYTPTAAPADYRLTRDAVIHVIRISGKGTSEHTISPAELPTYHLASTPYFTIHRDAQGRITAMTEIYHP